MYCECTCLRACKVVQNCPVLQKNSLGRSHLLIGRGAGDCGKGIFYVSVDYRSFSFLLFFIYSHMRFLPLIPFPQKQVLRFGSHESETELFDSFLSVFPGSLAKTLAYCWVE